MQCMAISHHALLQCSLHLLMISLQNTVAMDNQALLSLSFSPAQFLSPFLYNSNVCNVLLIRVFCGCVCFPSLCEGSHVLVCGSVSASSF